MKNKLDLKITPELKEEADTRDLIRKIQAERKKLGTDLNQKIKVRNAWLPKTSKLLEWLKVKTLCDVIEVGEFKINEI